VLEIIDVRPQDWTVCGLQTGKFAAHLFLAGAKFPANPYRYAALRGCDGLVPASLILMMPHESTLIFSRGTRI